MNAPYPRQGFPAGGIDPAAEAFKAAMRHLAGGVSIVTVADNDEKGGLTATSMVSLSADPPSLLVAVTSGASSLPLMRRSGRFAVSILGQQHGSIADRFAGRDGRRGAARFEDAAWIGRPGMPLVLADALASFECDLDEMLERFSHTIIIGKVTASRVHAVGGGALVYWRAAYGHIGSDQSLSRGGSNG